MYFQLAWRNLWRNPKRTIVIMLAILIGVWSMIVVSAFSQGALESSIQNGISTLTGHLQIHQKDYRDDPVVEHSIQDPGTITNALNNTLPSGSVWSARVRINGVVNNARHSGGITLVGIDPEREAKVSFIGTAVTQGTYLDPEDMQGILIGRALAEKFETGKGKKLVLMSQDTTGEIASRAFTIVGIFNADMESTEKQFVFVTKEAAQEMLQLGNAISEVAILLPDRQEVNRVAESLRETLSSDKYDVDTWQQLLPLLKTYLDVFKGYLYLMYIVVFIAMGFGIVNTILMAVMERIREFGLLNALGMKSRSIIKEVMIESFFLLVLGTGLGNLLGIFSIHAFSSNGIDLSAFAKGSEFWGMSRVIYPMVKIQNMIVANLVVLGLGVLVSLYPAVKATRFNPVDTLTRL
jgi:ABC-type lipoprotein release transport system permease subunit